MKKKLAFVLFTLPALLLAMASCTTTNNASAEVETFIKETYRNALAEGDADTIVNAYTADGIMMPQGFATASGQAAVRQVYEAIFAGLAYDLQFTIDEVLVFGDYAVARTRSAGTVSVKASNESSPDTNRELWVLRKVDGAWKIARYMFNKDGS